MDKQTLTKIYKWQKFGMKSTDYRIRFDCKNVFAY